MDCFVAALLAMTDVSATAVSSLSPLWVETSEARS
jgi:hypothetical protein